MHTEDCTTPDEEKQVLFPTTEEIIIAMLLGDGHAQGKKSKCIDICHSIKQHGYVSWKLDLLKRFVHPNTDFKSRKHDPPQVRITTPSTPAITEVYHKLYINGVKQITQPILDKVTLLGLAIWFMDDGSVAWQRKNRRGELLANPKIISVRLSTEGFSLKENELICQWLFDKFNVLFRVIFVLGSCKWTLHVSTSKDVSRFLELMRPFVMQVECMKYKIGL